MSDETQTENEMNDQAIGQDVDLSDSSSVGSVESVV